MAKKNNIWGTVCDDSFEEIDAQAACHTLRFNGLTHMQVAYNSGFSLPKIPILMNSLGCTSRTDDFLQCPQRTCNSPCGCSHSEDIVLTCY